MKHEVQPMQILDLIDMVYRTYLSHLCWKLVMRDLPPQGKLDVLSD